MDEISEIKELTQDISAVKNEIRNLMLYNGKFSPYVKRYRNKLMDEKLAHKAVLIRLRKLLADRYEKKMALGKEPKPTSIRRIIQVRR